MLVCDLRPYSSKPSGPESQTSTDRLERKYEGCVVECKKNSFEVHVHNDKEFI